MVPPGPKELEYWITEFTSMQFFDTTEEKKTISDLIDPPQDFVTIPNIPDLSFKDFKDEFGKTFEVEEFSTADLEDETIETKTMKEMKIFYLDKMNEDGSTIVLEGYPHFRKISRF